jgi:hypothetical protein
MRFSAGRHANSHGGQRRPAGSPPEPTVPGWSWPPGVALLLAEAAPDTVDLPGPQRERETPGPDRAARADRPRLGRLLQRPARGREREEQIGIGGPAGGKLPPLAVGRQSRPLGAIRRQPGGRLVKAPRARLRPARTTASSERACMAALRRRCTCTPASRCGRPGPPAQALSPARVAPQSRAMAKAGRNQHRHGCPRTTDPAVLRSRESPGSGDAS